MLLFLLLIIITIIITIMPPSPKASRRKRRKLDDDELAISQMTFTTTVMLMATLLVHYFFALGTGRSCDIHRQRKDFKRDIVPQFGDRFFRRAYRMRLESFYHLHDLLQADLEKQFFPTGWGARDFRSSPYLIQTDMRL